MMHLLRKYDVAPVGRNDAMFAPMCRQAHIIRVANIIRRSRHHLPKANIIEKSTSFEVLFSDGDMGARTLDLSDVNRTL